MMDTKTVLGARGGDGRALLTVSEVGTVFLMPSKAIFNVRPHRAQGILTRDLQRAQIRTPYEVLVCGKSTTSSYRQDGLSTPSSRSILREGRDHRKLEMLRRLHQEKEISIFSLASPSMPLQPSFLSSNAIFEHGFMLRTRRTYRYIATVWGSQGLVSTK
jgi:hypothetical protein